MVGYADMLSETEPEKITVPYDPKLGFEYLKKVGMKGYKSAASLLAHNYSLKDNRYGIEFNLGKSECWAEIHKELYPESPYDFSLAIHRAKNYGKNIHNFTRFDPKTYCQKELKL